MVGYAEHTQNEFEGNVQHALTHSLASRADLSLKTVRISFIMQGGKQKCDPLPLGKRHF